MLLNAGALNSVSLDGPGTDAELEGGHRFVSDAELALLTESTGYAVYASVRIADSDGIMQDYAERDAINWIHSLEWGADIDSAIATAVVRLWREVGGRSLAPLQTNSAYNAAGPSIDAGRRIEIAVAIVALGTEPDDTDWRPVFAGVIDRVEWSASPIEVTARDLGGILMDTWFAGQVTFTDGGTGTPVEEVIQYALDSLELDQEIELYTPEPSLAMLVTPNQPLLVADVEPGFDALTRLAQVPGWDIRYRWSDLYEDWRLTFRDPGRDKTVPDWTLRPSQYIGVSQMAVDRLNIRNDITVHFPDSAVGDTTTVRRFANAVSVARYGRRSMVIKEASNSAINTTAEADQMIQAILSDIAEPKAEKTFDMPFFWPVELHDLIRFIGNAVHYTGEQEWAVVRYRHRLMETESRTVVDVRGGPVGSWWNWLRRAGGTPVDPGTPPSPPGFSALAQIGHDDTDTIDLNWTWTGDAAATFEIWVKRQRPDELEQPFIIDGTEIAGSSTHSYAASADLDPTGSGTLFISFYVNAFVGTTLAAKSVEQGPISYTTSP